MPKFHFGPHSRRSKTRNKTWGWRSGCDTKAGEAPATDGEPFRTMSLKPGRGASDSARIEILIITLLRGGIERVRERECTRVNPSPCNVPFTGTGNGHVHGAPLNPL